ncbi:MAG: PilZ domain-containing protein [Pseudomonadota bacterium]
MGDRKKAADRRSASQPVSADRRRSDRRQSVRAPIDMWMEESKGNELYFRRTGNLSSGGVFFEQSIPHPLGTRVSLKFTLPGHQTVIEAVAEIVNTPGEKDGLGMGVRFVELGQPDRDRIASFVRQSVENPGAR